MSYELIKVFLDAGALVVAFTALGFSIYAAVANRRRDDRKELAAIRDALEEAIDEGDDRSAHQLADHAQRIARIETQLASGPSREELKELRQELHTVSDALSRLHGEFNGMRDLVAVSRRQTELIDQWLRSRESHR
ncbi:MAG: hypothetical protein NXI21_01830 [Alphaproteobacteria bacterium]|nr:hypothetical protein [Alphaproteobacteria bacterium]